MTKELYEKMWAIFTDLGINALTLNHYNLAEETEIRDPQLWRKFLTEPEVADWIKSEISIIQESELKKMIKDISSSRSVGQAQLMNTLAKLGESHAIKEGPIFIYSYIPLNPQQEQAENVKILEFDPFIKEDLQ